VVNFSSKYAALRGILEMKKVNDVALGSRARKSTYRPMCSWD
jgi:hypothetical protein